MRVGALNANGQKIEDLPKQKNLQLAIRDIKNQKKEEQQEKLIC